MIEPPAPELDRRATRRAFILVLVGLPIALIDFTIGISGVFVFDVFHDTAGYLLYAIAAFTLAVQPGPGGSRGQLVFVGGAMVGLALWALVIMVAPNIAGTAAGAVAWAVEVAAVLVFCIAMLRLLRFHGLPRSAASWRTSAILVAVLWGAIPLAVIAVLSLIGRGPSGFYAPLSAIGPGEVGLFLLAVVVLLTPGVHIIVSLARSLGDLPAASPAVPQAT